jgi:hypothetical protein
MNSKVPKSDVHILKNQIYQNYILELNKLGFYKNNRYNKPLHLYSFYVYLAYLNLWKLINRKKLCEDQIDIMKRLNCYKSTRTEVGTRSFPPMHFAELPLVS